MVVGVLHHQTILPPYGSLLQSLKNFQRGRDRTTIGWLYNALIGEKCRLPAVSHPINKHFNAIPIDYYLLAFLLVNA